MEKNILQYFKKDCDETLVNKIYSEIEKKGINLSNDIGGGVFIFDKETYMKFECELISFGSHYLTITIEQPVKKFFGIKREMKLPKDLIDVLDSFNFKKTLMEKNKNELEI